MKALLSIKKADWNLILILFVAFLLRIIFIDIKPPHFDEGVNGWFVDQIFQTGFFKYDPTNYHGPLHFYILAVMKLFFGRTLMMLRISSVLFGVANIYLIAQLFAANKKKLQWFIALLITVSPGMIFYNRYGIHESGFLFFTLLFILGYQRQQFNHLIFGFLGMILMKETWVLTLPALGVAAVLSKQWVKAKINYHSIVIALFIFILFYSGFFKNWHGIVDFFKTFMPWYKTGVTGNGHQKEFYYWFKLFYIYEPFAIIGILASLKFLFTDKSWLKFFSIFALVQLFIYSAIPYKTPWCVLQLIWPFYALGACLFTELFKLSNQILKTAMILCAVVLFSTTTSKALSLNYIKYTDPKEPYVYVQTFNEVKDVLAVIYKKSSPKLSVVIAMKSNWPLPWLLGDYQKMSYYDSCSRLKPSADVIFCDENTSEGLQRGVYKDYYSYKFKLRDAMADTVVYFSKSVFEHDLDQLKTKEGFR